jgi:glucuronoarabinoxylan endo-1,4-beta-xylanase
MEAEGVPLTAITPQNEPDWPAEWDGCLYTPSEMVTFIRDHLGPEFEARGLDDVMIFAPDTAHMKNLPSFADALVADTEAMKYLDGISTHPYSQQGDIFDTSWSVPRDNNLLFWQTEISYEKFFETPTPATDTPDPGMKTALWMGKMMHEHLTKLQVNAWNYWNLTAVEDDYIDNPDRQNPAFIQDGVIFKRAYVMGNYSKFVRPGAVRIEAPAEPAADIYVSAFENDERVTIVAINDGTAASNQTFTLQGELAYPIVDVVPWVTSDTLALEAQAALTMTDGSFSFELPPKSVTSLVVTLDAPVPVGTGGSPGVGGSDASGGSGGADGSGVGGAGTGAESGVGGAPSGAGGVVGAGGDAGVVGSGGTAPTGPNQSGDMGCACRTTGYDTGSAASKWGLALLGLGAIFARRRLRVQ